MITYQEESYSEIIEELKPLLELHYKEIAMYQDNIDLNPNYGIYEIMYETGQVHFYTARDNKELVGYAITFMQQHPHYMDHVFAVNDIVYVKEEHRHTDVAPTMLTKLEQIMKDDGVSVMTFHMKSFKPFETLMDYLEFDKAEFLFTKYIKDD